MWKYLHIATQMFTRGKKPWFQYSSSVDVCQERRCVFISESKSTFLASESRWDYESLLTTEQQHFMDDSFVNLGGGNSDFALTIWRFWSATVCFVISLSICYWRSNAEFCTSCVCVCVCVSERERETRSHNRGLCANTYELHYCVCCACLYERSVWVVMNEWMKRICLCFNPFESRSRARNSVSSAVRYAFNLFLKSRARDFTTFTLHDLTVFHVERATALHYNKLSFMFS